MKTLKILLTFWPLLHLTAAYSQVELLKDINPGTASSKANDFIEYDGKVFFKAKDGLTGTELWEYDGTVPTQVADIYPGALGGVSFAIDMIVYQDALYFPATDGVNGTELWKYENGNVEMVANINSGLAASHPQHFHVHNGLLFFEAETFDYGDELWVFDGINASLVADIAEGDDDSNINSFASFGAQLLFAADDGIVGSELWKHDGNQTVLVEDLGWSSSGPSDFTLFQSEMYFLARSDLYKYDGNAITLIAELSLPDDLTLYNNQLYFSTNHNDYGNEIWRYDGMDIHLVKDINPGSESAAPNSFFVWNQTLYFSANDDIHGEELWAHDGSDTYLVQDVWEGSGWSSPRHFIEFDSELYFTVWTAEFGNELWKFDGMEAVLVEDIFPGPTDSEIDELSVMGNDLYFGAEDDVHGFEPRRIRGCQPTSATLQIEACDAYTSPNTGTIWTSDGTYTEVIDNAEGCDSTITIQLTITSLEATVSTTNLPQLEAAPVSTAISYQWFNCDNGQQINGETNAIFTPVANGNYAVILTGNNCVDTSDCVSFIGVNSAEKFSDDLVQLFPNPTEGNLTFNMGKIYPNLTIVLRNLSGKKIKDFTRHQQQIFTLSLDSQPGVYFLEIWSEGELFVRKKIVKF